MTIFIDFSLILNFKIVHLCRDIFQVRVGSYGQALEQESRFASRHRVLAVRNSRVSAAVYRARQPIRPGYSLYYSLITSCPITINANRRGLPDQLHFRLHERHSGNQDVCLRAVGVVLGFPTHRHLLLLRQNHRRRHQPRIQTQRTGV